MAARRRPPSLFHSDTNPRRLPRFNGRIYESDLVWDLLVWRLDDDRVSQFIRTPFSNPQSQLFAID